MRDERTERRAARAEADPRGSSTRRDKRRHRSARTSRAPVRRPRVGVDFHTFDGIFQGSRSHLLGLYREAVTLAPDIDFVMLLDNPHRLVREHPEFAAPNVYPVRMRHLPGALRLGAQLSWHQWRDRLDLLHVQYRLPLLSTGPCACTIHDVLFETHPQYFSSAFVRWSRLASRAAARRADLLFTVSRFSQHALADAYGVPPSRIRVTYNAVDTARFHPGREGIEVPVRHGLAPGGYLCTLGRLEPRKNHLALVRAYAKLPKRGRPPLIIIGQPDFGYQQVYEEIEALKLRRQVRILSDIDDADLPSLLRHARLFVYPSWAEGFGMPVLEAMASGVPVVTSTTTSLPEVAGRAARLVSPDDDFALSSAIRQELMAGESYRRERIARGIQQARRFNWQSSATVLIEGFRRLLRRR